MSRQRGFTLIELITYLSLASVGMCTGYTLWATSELTNRRHTEAFNRHSAVAAVLSLAADDLRDSVRVAPRAEGPGGVIFKSSGEVVVYYDRPDTPGALYRKVVRGGAGEQPRVVARGITALAFESEDSILTARATAGAESRAISVRRRP
jgi:prepilin-type N-terminal cleavage/methylation domain-containing protein